MDASGGRRSVGQGTPPVQAAGGFAAKLASRSDGPYQVVICKIRKKERADYPRW